MSLYVRQSKGRGFPNFRITSIDQAAPVQNTWYTVANLQNIQCNRITFTVQATDETLELELTIDGVALAVVSQAATAATAYTVDGLYVSWDGTHYFVVNAANPKVGEAPFFKCQSLLVRLRKTTANGVGHLRGAVSYLQY